MAAFSIPDIPDRSIIKLTQFYGVDFTSNPFNVDMTQSPDAENMIRSEPGKVRKRMGYHTVYRFEGKINGHYARKKDEFDLIHAGTGLYRMKETPELLYSGMNDAKSSAWQFGDKLYIVDGKKFLVYDGTDVKPVEDDAYIPTVTIAKAPSGGGKQYNALNLLQPLFREKFLSDGTSTEYHLSFSGLDDANVTVRQLQSNGEWKAISGFTCNAQTGVVTFATAPGKSPVTGEDNIEIEARRTVSGYADRINKCCIGARFGVNGDVDRLFLSGNPDYINYDWYSQKDDPTYFPDTGYSVLGTNKSAIVGYTIIENRLAAHKDDYEPDRNIIMRSGNLVESEAAFPIYNTMKGPGAVARDSFAYLQNEPVFLTSAGIYAIAASDINAERYSQDRSYYLNGKLLQEPNLKDACACVYNDMYWLCVNGHAYVLDGLQNLGLTKSEPYSNRQYVAFYCTNIPACLLFVKDGALWFGTDDGRVCRFYTDETSHLSYSDDGAAISASWQTPYISGTNFYKVKTFKHLAVQLVNAASAGVKIAAIAKGEWKTIKEFLTGVSYFSYSRLVYSHLCYSNDTSPKTFHTKLRIKRVDKCSFRFTNDMLHESFGIVQASIEYVEGGNYKG